MFNTLKFLLGLFKGWTKRKAAETPKLYAEDWIWEQQVKQDYIFTQNSFHYCMQNRLLKRRDILEFKEKLNKCVNLKDYRYEKFKNDAHEIYRKLKSTCITKKEMQMLNEYLQPFIAAEPKKIIYGHLTVVK